MKEMLVREILQLKSGAQVSAFKGVLKTLYQVQQRGGAYPSSAQGAVMVDSEGSEIAVDFIDEAIRLEGDKGRMILIECTTSQRGSSGVKFKIDSWQDKQTGQPRTKQKLHVTKSAKITVLTAGGTQSTRQQPAPQQQAPQQQSQQGRSAYQQSGNQPQPQAQPQEKSQNVNQRIKDWFRVFKLVMVESEGLTYEDGEEILSVDNIKDITTTMVLGFKGQYGFHAPVVFEGEQSPQSTEKAAAFNWREVLHPKTNKTLGEIFDTDKELMMALCRWTSTSQPKPEESQETRKVRAGCSLCCAENNWDDEANLFMESVRILAESDDMIFAAQAAIAGKSPDELLAMLKDFAKTMEELKKSSIDDDEIPS